MAFLLVAMGGCVPRHGLPSGTKIEGSWQVPPQAKVFLLVHLPDTELDEASERWAIALSGHGMRLDPWFRNEDAVARVFSGATIFLPERVAMDRRAPWILAVDWTLADGADALRLRLVHADGRARPREGIAEPDVRWAATIPTSGGRVGGGGVDSGIDAVRQLLASVLRTEEQFVIRSEDIDEVQALLAGEIRELQASEELTEDDERVPSFETLRALARYIGGEDVGLEQALRREQLARPSSEPWISWYVTQTIESRYELAEIRARIWTERPEYLRIPVEQLVERGESPAAYGVLMEALARLGADVADIETQKENALSPGMQPRLVTTADLQFDRGWVAYSMGDLEVALEAYSMAYEYYRVMGMSFAKSTTQNNLGVALIEAGRPLSGIRELEESVRIRDELAYEVHAASGRYSLGLAYSSLGRNEESIKVLDEAVDAYQRHEDWEGEIDCWVARLVPAAALGRSGMIVAAQERASTLEQGWSRADLYTAIGEAWISLGAHEEALKMFDVALADWRTVEDAIQIGRVHYNRAIALLGMGSVVEAVQALSHARVSASSGGDFESVTIIDEQLRRIQRLFGAELPE